MFRPRSAVGGKEMKIFSVVALAVSMALATVLWAQQPRKSTAPKSSVAAKPAQSEDDMAFADVLAYARPEKDFVAPPKKGYTTRDPFLFLVWLNKGDPKYGCRYSLAPNGKDWGLRILYNWAVQGGDQTGQDKATCQKLLQINGLPQGAASPSSIPRSRLLIVGLRQGQKWEVRNYDRQNLPPIVQTITQLTKRPYN